MSALKPIVFITALTFMALVVKIVVAQNYIVTPLPAVIFWGALFAMAWATIPRR